MTVFDAELFLKKPKIKESLNSDEDPGGKIFEPIERFDIAKSTKVINFDETEKVRDDLSAGACVEVMTSDGETGTLSHLVVSDNPDWFAQDLRQLVGRDGVPAIIVGGTVSRRDSVRLVRGLVDRLRENGFIVSTDPEHSDIGPVPKRINRISTLYRDRVEVERFVVGGEKQETLELKFPSYNSQERN